MKRTGRLNPVQSPIRVHPAFTRYAVAVETSTEPSMLSWAVLAAEQPRALSTADAFPHRPDNQRMGRWLAVGATFVLSPKPMLTKVYYDPYIQNVIADKRLYCLRYIDCSG